MIVLIQLKQGNKVIKKQRATLDQFTDSIVNSTGDAHKAILYRHMLLAGDSVTHKLPNKLHYLVNKA